MNPQVDKFLKIPFYQRLLIVLALMALIAVGFYFGLFVPKQKEYNALVKKSNDLQAEIVQKKSIADNLVQIQQEYERMQQQLQESLKELPNDKEIPELLTSIASLANQNNLDVKKFLPGSEVAKGFYAEVPVSLSLVGRYHEIGKFFYDIGEMSRIVNVGNIKMKREGDAKSGKMQVAVDCQATTYRFLRPEEQPQAPAGAKGKKPAAGAKNK